MRHLHVYLDDCHLRPHRMLDLEPIWLGVQDGRP